MRKKELILLTMMIVNSFSVIASAEEGIFQSNDLNDWCTCTRLINDKSTTKFTIEQKSKEIAYLFSEAKSFNDDFEKNSWKESTALKIQSMLNACGKYSDKVVLEVGYTFRDKSYDFNNNVLTVRIPKDLAAYPQFNDFILRRSENYIATPWSKQDTNERQEYLAPEINAELKVKIDDDGVKPRIANFFKNYRASAKKILNQFEVPENDKSLRAFVPKTIYFSGNREIRVRMATDVAKKINNLSKSQKINVVVEYQIKHVDEKRATLFAIQEFYLLPMKVTFFDAESRQKIFSGDSMN